RPIHHWLAPRVRAHVFLCMLACHVEWHMRERLRPMLFDDDDPTAAARERASIVAPAQPSPAALRKRASKVTADGGPLHSFHSLLRDLATCTLNEMTAHSTTLTVLRWSPRRRRSRPKPSACSPSTRPSCSQ